MHKAIQSALDKKLLGRAKPRRKFIVLGTDHRVGHDVSFEWAPDRATAWKQALLHAEGTSFTPESIEETKS